MANQRNVAVSIGVGNASKLRYLPAAVNGAKLFFDWASRLGYEATLLTDEDDPETLAPKPVTMIRLRQTLESVLATPVDGSAIHRCILYFAGHGLIREAEEGLWLLSDWYSEARAVAVEVLKRRLCRFGITQIAIFSDSCRSLPSDLLTADLIGDGVLGLGPKPLSTDIAVDKFVAAQDGSVAYSIPGDTPEADRCIFTGVLLEGLWGVAPSAFSKTVTAKVTSSSLGTYLKTEVPKVASKYQLTLNPSVAPTFPEEDNVYFGDVVPPPTPPVFPKWPPRKTFDVQSAAVAAIAEVVKHVTNLNFQLVQSSTSNFEALIRSTLRESQTSEHARLARNADQFAAYEKFTAQMSRQSTNWPMQESGFEVEGAQIAAVWKEEILTVRPDPRANGGYIFQENGAPVARPFPVLVELESKSKQPLFVGLAALPRFGAFLICDESGASALRYGSIMNDPITAQAVEKALAAMESGALRGDQAKTLALALREGKHAAPVLGAIAAYLYDSVGDLESIRRMAHFYVEKDQPIPYDIAMLGQLDGQWKGAQLMAKVPSLAARELPDPDALWDAAARDECWGVVGGAWPWIKQGWAFLDDPEDVQSPLIRPELLEARKHLARSRFATLDTAGATLLANAFGLRRTTIADIQAHSSNTSLEAS